VRACIVSSFSAITNPPLQEMTCGLTRNSSSNVEGGCSVQHLCHRCCLLRIQPRQQAAHSVSSFQIVSAGQQQFFEVDPVACLGKGSTDFIFGSRLLMIAKRMNIPISVSECH
jgi:hypothetical protein